MSTVRIAARPRRWPAVAVAALILFAILFTLLSGFVIDLLWFREVGQSDVFWITLRTKVVLGALFGIAFFALVYANLVIARMLRPTTRALTPDQEVIERLRDLSEPYLRWLIPGGAALLALLVGVGVSHQWQTYLLWRNSSGISFGNPEPLFNRDPAFYVFSLPWLRFVQGWLFSSLAGVTVLTAIAHVLWGGIRPQAPAFADKVTPAVRAHLSVLLGLIMLVKAWGYWLGRFDLLTSPRGVVEGASYTDVNAQLPALRFLAVVAVICAVLFFLNIRVKLWSLPVIAVGLLAIVSVLLGTAYPAFVQQFRVKPNGQQYETPYIAHNIEATRRAFGLDVVTEEHPQVGGALSADELRQNRDTVNNIRLWRPEILRDNFLALQRLKQYYDFHDVDVDRYPVGASGERVLMVSGREISQNGIPGGGGTWVNQHLTYTHGYGAVASLVNTATPEGQPVLTLQDIPPVGDPALVPTQPRIYYGESTDVPYVIVRTTTAELDYEGAPENQQYQGRGGIQLGNILERAMFAWKYHDLNLLISGQIRPDSRILIYRDITQRVPKLAPFLQFDHDPYLAIVDGRLKWIWDAYTLTNGYPYSQSVDLDTATADVQTVPGGGLHGQANYLRNSVKAVVDAYDGTVTLYANEQEPIIQAWSRAFPELFTDITTAEPALQAHFRYPENLFEVQTTQYANYHVTDPAIFYQKQDFWAVPQDPTVTLATGQSGPSLKPYYVLMKLPGETNETFHLVLPFVPEGRQNMVAWMAADSDPSEYGRLVSFRFPTDRNIDGPSQILSRINANQEFSSQRTLLSTAGSTVSFGDFLVVPIDDSFLYVQPVYVRASSENSIPELKFVMVVNGSGGSISLGSNLSQAIQKAGGEAGGGGGGGGGQPGGGSVDQRIQNLLAQALDHFANAQDALTAGNLALYQSELALAQNLVEQANELASQTSPSPSPSPSVSPSASPSP
jgi:uncharacterized membrane protein (UPF0182 family)